MHTALNYAISFYTLIKQSIQAFSRHDMSIYAAALAFHVLFSLFPFIIFLIALVSFFELPTFFDWLRLQAQALLPPSAMTQVHMVISELALPPRGLLSTGVAVALWVASRGVRCLMTALNIAYGAKRPRPTLRRYTLSILYTVGMAVMLLAAAALLVLGPQAMQWLALQVGLERFFVVLWSALRWPALIVLFILALAVVYHAGPNVHHRFRLISAGSVLSVGVWVAISLAFEFYVQNFANYNVMYGSIGTVIALLLYLYILAAVLLFGAEVNAVIERAPSVPAAPGVEQRQSGGAA
ncbi:YihY/virulence factor BrkB family protein [Massilia glaciei]|nr:YihY/virulence factor BrkB family protein [Massilia glaciei]